MGRCCSTFWTVHALDQNSLPVAKLAFDAQIAVNTGPGCVLEIDFATSDLKIRQKMKTGEVLCHHGL